MRYLISNNSTVIELSSIDLPIPIQYSSKMDWDRILSKKNWQGKNWLRQLNRERIDAGRELILYIVRLIFDRPLNPSADQNLKSKKNYNQINPQTLKKVLIFHFDDKIGDMVINSILFRELKKLNPQMLIDVVTGQNTFDLINGHSRLNKVFLFKKGFFQTLQFAHFLQKEKYDCVIDPRTGTDARTIFILSQIKPTWSVGFHKKNYQIYTHSIDQDVRNIHSSEKVSLALQQFKVQKYDLNYDLEVNIQISQNVQAILQKHHFHNYVLMNLYSGARFRNFLPETTKRIIHSIRNHQADYPIVLIGPPAKHSDIRNIMTGLSDKKIFFFPEIQKISQIMALVQFSKLTISPDTSIVHIASAFHTPIIDIICDDSEQSEKNTIQWAPRSPSSRMIIASGKTDGEVDVNTFSDQDLQKSLAELLH